MADNEQDRPMRCSRRGRVAAVSSFYYLAMIRRSEGNDKGAKRLLEQSQEFGRNLHSVSS